MFGVTEAHQIAGNRASLEYLDENGRQWSSLRKVTSGRSIYQKVPDPCSIDLYLDGIDLPNPIAVLLN